MALYVGHRAMNYLNVLLKSLHRIESTSSGPGQLTGSHRNYSWDSDRKRDFYEVLEVKKDATSKEIKFAYYRLVKKCHPDLCTDADAKHKFQEVCEAYEVLIDANRRSIYDEYGYSIYFTQTNCVNLGHNTEEILRKMFANYWK